MKMILPVVPEGYWYIKKHQNEGFPTGIDITMSH